MESITAVDPVAPYVGGKRNLAKRLIPLIEAIAHTTYAEPFVGMGGVFFRRTERPKAEIINDAGRDVATFFRILQRHYVPFMEMMRFQLTTRTEFERLAATDPTTLTDLERAARFLYLQRTAFGGKVMGRTFGVDRGRPGRFDMLKLGPMLEAVHERLSGVVVECLDFEAFITRYDRPATLFYIDPPYWGTEGYYDAPFTRDDFGRLKAALTDLQGRFILSINDRPEVREMFQEFEIVTATTTYSVGKDNATKAGELIISNGPLKPTSTN